MRLPAKKIQFIKSDKLLLVALLFVLVVHYGNLANKEVDYALLTFFASVATLPVFFSAYQSVKNKKINVDLLAGVALAVSLLNQQWASAVFINLMLTSARIFDSYTQNQAKNAIKSLLKLRPEKVKVKKGEEIIEEVISKIVKGDLVIVELGERIPVDGIIVSGQAEVDQSSLTGESLPVHKKEGEMVLSSTLNVSGSLVIRAERVGKDTTFEKIVKLVEQSQQDKVGIQTTADKFASWYILVTIVGSLLIYAFSRDLKLVLSVLLVACADDIAVAIPMAFSAGIGAAARDGIIIKGGEYLEGLMKVKTIVMDKTGTLTKGKLKVAKIFPFASFDEKQVAAFAASADFFSEHPVARAVVQYAKENEIIFEKADKFEEFSGKGLVAKLKENQIVCGKTTFLEQQKIKFTDEQLRKIEEIKQQNPGSILQIAVGEELIGVIVLEDEIRSEVKQTIEKLRNLGIKNTVMLTGDNEKVAQKVASELGLTKFYANLLPEDKISHLKEYLGGDGKVAMMGDGVNDAASLALADIGIAMGAIGTDAAIEAADVALMKDDFSKVADAIELGKSVEKISRQDFWIWGILNVIGLGLVFLKIIGPEGAAAYNFVTDFIPLLNSMRMFGYKFTFFTNKIDS